MRISSYAVARPAYYDRNSTSLMVNGNANAVGPHAFTTRVTQTCPAGTKYLWEYAYVSIERNTAAAVSGTIYTIDRVVNAAATDLVSIIATGAAYPTVGGINYISTACSVSVYPGEQIQGLTRDDSTGGTVTYVIGNKLTAYSA